MKPRFLVGAGVVLALLFLGYHLIWGSVEEFTVAMDHCAEPLCDFSRYYYPMGQEILSSRVPAAGFFYSPFFALLLAPLGALPLDVARLAWGACQLILVGVLALMPAFFGVRSRGLLLAHLLLVLTTFPVLHNLKWGQVSTLLVVSLLLGVSFYRQGSRILAATAIAIAIAIKFYPALLLALFLFRGDLRFLALTVGVTFIFLFALPAIVLGPGATMAFYRLLFDTLSIARETMVLDNNSQYFPSVVSRLYAQFGGVETASEAPLRWVGLALGAVNLVLLFGALRLADETRIVWGIVILFLTLPFVVPTSWPHYFVYLPFCQIFLLWQVGARDHSNVARAILAAMLLLSIVCSSVVLSELSGGGEIYGFLGFPFFANALLLAACYGLLARPVVRLILGGRIVGVA